MKGKVVAVVTLMILAALFTVSAAYAQGSWVTGIISADNPTIFVHRSVTLTCAYTSSMNAQGSGQILMSGPKATLAGPFTSSQEIKAWDTISSGVPVTYTLTLNETGYYKFRWLCSGGVDGAYTEITVQALDTPFPLPDAPSLAALAVCFAGAGVFLVVVKKRTPKTSS